MSNSFEQTLDQIMSMAETSHQQGKLFERLIKQYFTEDPVYSQRFSKVWSWEEWAAENPGFGATDIGIDLVAEESQGGYCAAQCKCYSPDTRISKNHIDSFISASANDLFTSRIIVCTSDDWGPNARKTIKNVSPPCTVLGYGHLSASDMVWPDLQIERPETLSFKSEKFTLRSHQIEALNDVISGFIDNDQGRLIMPCGTGKTFTALRTAEQFAGLGRRVLYLVPSISLLAQTIREWATHKRVPHLYIGICSDKKAGYDEEDSPIQDLEIPVTTDPEAISQALCRSNSDVMTVVFCTYQSLELVAEAQDAGAPDFDLVLCDEAHRTTGIERSEGKKSPFVLVHDKERIRVQKRLYMTATPRLYTEGAKSKAARYNTEVFSMDDPEVYGPEFHRLTFADAVEKDLLSDYKVVVFGISETHVEPSLQMHLASNNKEVGITVAAQILGCWRALQNPENKNPEQEVVKPLRRAIAFTNRIDSSKNLESYWKDIVQHTIEQGPENGKGPPLICDVKHVDGKHNALYRKKMLDWLKGDSEGVCRILTNAKCLSEGIDVPALDAVLFMSPRNSQVDVVQAVGRAMRKAEGKKYGYIILPVAVPAGVAAEDALDDNKRFAAVWTILRALRSHDERFDAEINRIDLNNSPSERIIVIDGGGGDRLPRSDFMSAELPFLDLPAGAFYAKVVERCGDRKYWQNWAEDVADIFLMLVEQIKNLLDHKDSEILCQWFDAFLEDLKGSINDSITREDAVEMMAQHILTKPVFEALFEHYDFADTNPVAQSLNKLLKDFEDFGLQDETKDLAPFYKSVRERVRGLDNTEARQRVLMDLYQNFFAKAIKKEANRLGIVYTPVEIVDFILNSADQILREEFGLSLSDENVHILDPFTGTGTFLVRLIQSPLLVKDSDLLRKYQEELHANEIILLAYYIAAIHIEEAFHGRCGPESSYKPFKGILLVDTFNMYPGKTNYPHEWFPDNSERTENQQNTPIQVIVGNPPYSAFNENARYQFLDNRIQKTYKEKSLARLKTSLDDSYIRAIRWSSDRIDEEGVIVFVTNGSFIDSNATDGVRACLSEEFSTVYCFNLRGNQRTQGERSKMEGGKIFGSGSRAPVAITAFVKNPKSKNKDCRIHYYDIGDYLDREQKIDIVRKAKSVSGIIDWKNIEPNSHHDWINKRDESFQELIPLGEKSTKKMGGGVRSFSLTAAA